MRIKDVTLEAKKGQDVPISWGGIDQVMSSIGFKSTTQGYGSNIPREKTYYDEGSGVMIDFLAPSSGTRNEWSALLRVHSRWAKDSRIESKGTKIFLTAPEAEDAGNAIDPTTAPDSTELGESVVDALEGYRDSYLWATAVEEGTASVPFLQGRIDLNGDVLTLSGVQFHKGHFNSRNMEAGIQSMIAGRDEIFESIQSSARRCSLRLDDDGTEGAKVFTDGTRSVVIQSAKQQLGTGISMSVRSQKTVSKGGMTLPAILAIFTAAGKAREFPWDRPLG